jgi:hypothetical protein
MRDEAGRIAAERDRNDVLVCQPILHLHTEHAAVAESRRASVKQKARPTSKGPADLTRPARDACRRELFEKPR